MQMYAKSLLNYETDVNSNKQHSFATVCDDYVFLNWILPESIHLDTKNKHFKTINIS